MMLRSAFDVELSRWRMERKLLCQLLLLIYVMMMTICSVRAAGDEKKFPGDPSKPEFWATATNGAWTDPSNNSKYVGGYLNDTSGTTRRGDSVWKNPFFAQPQTPQLITIDANGCKTYKITVNKYEVIEKPNDWLIFGPDYFYSIKAHGQVTGTYKVCPTDGGWHVTPITNVDHTIGTPEVPLPVLSFIGTLLASQLCRRRGSAGPWRKYQIDE